VSLKEIRFNQENEKVRAALEEHLEINGVKNKQVQKITGLSCTTVSLFLQGRREIVPEKLDVIRKWINQ
jgi:transposase